MPSFDDETKRRWRGSLRRHRRNAVELGQQADYQIEKLLIRRFDRLVSVRRFVLIWVGLFVILFFVTFSQIRSLSPHYQKLSAVPGGVYSEGLVGTFTNANPIYATGTADVSITRLIFSGLLRYDNNNTLVGDLASDWVISPNQLQYTVHLKKNITWHDGKPFNADDVIFTYSMIQNAAAQSPLFASWKDIKVSKVDNYTLNFDLPNSLSSFPYALTNGIVPQHVLKSSQPERLRTSTFNTAPVGTGPFVWKYVEVSGTSSADRQQRISLSKFKDYWQGQPKLDGFSLITYSDEAHLVTAFKDNQISAMSGLENLPEELSHDSTINSYYTPLTSSVMVFFNNSRPKLNDTAIRKALVEGIDRQPITNMFGYPVQLSDEPLLRSQLGYDSSAAQLPYNPNDANETLDKAGWKMAEGGVRQKDGKKLDFHLKALSSQQYTLVSQFLQKQWAKIGVNVIVDYPPTPDDMQNSIANHDYDALLYGINLGVDPDEFAYWDSTQASISSQGHLNLSEYKSTPSDQALEAARTRSDPALRILKYKSFLEHWRDDVPALALYQPNYLYITRGPVFNYQRKADNSTADRFYEVNNWMVRQKRQTNQ